MARLVKGRLSDAGVPRFKSQAGRVRGLEGKAPCNQGLCSPEDHAGKFHPDHKKIPPSQNKQNNIEDVGFEAAARPSRQALGTKASQLEAPAKNGAADASRPEVLEFEVLGMTCGSCSATVERALRSTPDVAVAGVEVNLLAETATVSLASALQGAELESAAEALRQSIEDVGFEATAKLQSSGCLASPSEEHEATLNIMLFNMINHNNSWVITSS